jgi:molecular chaperone GrpE
MSERPDQQIEEPALAPDAGPPPEDGESELEVARRERDEYLDLAQRTRADLENYRRRVSAEAGVAERRGRAAVARDLIPALDDLERALLAVGVDPDGASPEGEPPSEEVSAQDALAEGVALVYREMRDGLRRGGVEAFDPGGEKFDPTTSEAVSTAGRDGVEAGVVIEVLEKGYRIGEVVLRPARVVVSA